MTVTKWMKKSLIYLFIRYMDWYKNKKSSSGVNSQLMSGQIAPKEAIVGNKKKSTKNQISPSKSTPREDQGTRFKMI